MLALDTFGPVGVPWLTTPDAFLLGLIAGPPADLSIDAGRIYVDGLLAELFPEEGATYLNQPFFPDPPPLPAGRHGRRISTSGSARSPGSRTRAARRRAGRGGHHDADCRRSGSCASSARDGAACGMPVGDPPSAGGSRPRPSLRRRPTIPASCRRWRLSRHREPALPRRDPDGGTLGTARFKWSRDNGSIVSPVTAIAVGGGQTTLTVNRIGRDQVLRFRIGDWVTVTDDHRELNGEPGEMAQIVDIDEAERLIVLDRALPTGRRLRRHCGRDRRAPHPPPALGPDRGHQHDRRRRPDADRRGADRARGRRAGQFSTDPAGGAFSVGDYWVFSARTATPRSRSSTAAPPRGIRHHYVQLAAISGLGGPAPASPIAARRRRRRGGGLLHLRRPPRREHPGGDRCIAAAGGCVCLKAGLHVVDAPVVIDRPNVPAARRKPRHDRARRCAPGRFW